MGGGGGEGEDACSKINDLDKADKVHVCRRGRGATPKADAVSLEARWPGHILPPRA